jgi:Cd2+/Zn2+-exporting ATPase
VVTDVVRLNGPDETSCCGWPPAWLAVPSIRSSAAIVASTGVRSRAPLLEVDDFEALTGRGVEGHASGQWYYLGNHRLLQELAVSAARRRRSC